MNIIVGNAVSLAFNVLMVVAGYIKSKKKALFCEIIYNTLATISCLFLGAYTGAVVTCISIPRAVLAYREKLNKLSKTALLIPAVALSLLVNRNNGWLGILPIISTISYTLFVDKASGRAFKLLGIWTVILWLVYDITTKNYVAALFDVGFAITSTIAIVRLTLDKKKGAQNGRGETT